MRAASVDVAEVIDRNPVGRLQYTVLALCGLVAVLDGFDNLAIALVAPSIARDFQVSVSSFGPVFGFNSFGLMVGALVLGPVADRVGRKGVILFAVALIGLFALLTPFSRSMNELMLVRFLSGIGIGGVMPNIIALTSEYSPRRLRATFVTIMFCGITVGAMICGLVTALLVASLGWRGVFYVGAAVPLFMLPALALLLPESIRFVVVRGRSPGKALALLRRLDPRASHDAATSCFVAEPATTGLSIAGLFRDGRAIITPVLWAVFFCNLLVWFFLTNWLPSVLQRAQFPMERALYATVILYGGGLIGGLTFGRMVDRNMSYTFLAVAYLCAAGSLAGMAFATSSAPFLLLPFVFMAGFFVAGCQYCINALAANLYPTDLRSTGVGCALGIGRVGSIVGPVVGGVLIARHWSATELLMMAMLPALGAAVAAFAISRQLTQARSARIGHLPAPAR